MTKLTEIIKKNKPIIDTIKQTGTTGLNSIITPEESDQDKQIIIKTGQEQGKDTSAIEIDLVNYNNWNEPADDTFIRNYEIKRNVSPDLLPDVEPVIEDPALSKIKTKQEMKVDAILSDDYGKVVSNLPFRQKAKATLASIVSKIPGETIKGTSKILSALSKNNPLAPDMPIKQEYGVNYYSDKLTKATTDKLEQTETVRRWKEEANDGLDKGLLGTIKDTPGVKGKIKKFAEIVVLDLVRHIPQLTITAINPYLSIYTLITRSTAEFAEMAQNYGLDEDLIDNYSTANGILEGVSEHFTTFSRATGIEGKSFIKIFDNLFNKVTKNPMIKAQLKNVIDLGFETGTEGAQQITSNVFLKKAIEKQIERNPDYAQYLEKKGLKIPNFLDDVPETLLRAIITSGILKTMGTTKLESLNIIDTPGQFDLFSEKKPETKIADKIISEQEPQKKLPREQALASRKEINKEIEKRGLDTLIGDETKKPLKEKMKKIIYDLHRGYVDGKFETWKLSKKKWEIELNPNLDTDPYFYSRTMYEKRAEIAKQDVINYLEPFITKYDPEIMADTMLYATAKTLQDRTFKDEGYELPKNWDDEKIAETINFFESQNHIDEINIIWDDLRSIINNSIIIPLEKNGIINKTQAQTLRDKETYLPSKKIKETYENNYPLQYLKHGSKDLVKNPLATIAEMIEATRFVIEQKNMNKAIITTGKNAEPENFYRVYQTANIDSVKYEAKKLKSFGYTDQQIEKELKKIFNTSYTRLQGFKNTVSENKIKNNPDEYIIDYVKGKKQIYKISKGIGEEMHNSNPVDNTVIAKIFEIPAVLLRTTATVLCRRFMVTNVMRDMATSEFLYQGDDYNMAVITPLNFFGMKGIKYLMGDVNMSDTQAWKSFITEWQNYAMSDSYLFPVNKDVQKKKIIDRGIRKRGNFIRKINATSKLAIKLNPYNLIKAGSNFSEFLNRAPSFDKGKKFTKREKIQDTFNLYGQLLAQTVSGDARRKGLSPYQHMLFRFGRAFVQFRWNIFTQAIQEYTRRGTLSHIIGKKVFHQQAKSEGLKPKTEAYKNRISELYNEKLEKKRKKFRGRKQIHIAKLAVITTMLMANNMSDDDHKKAWDAISKWDKRNYHIFLMPNPWKEINYTTLNKERKKQLVPNYIRIPKDDIVQGISNVTTDIMEFAYKKNIENGGDWNKFIKNLSKNTLDFLPIKDVLFGTFDMFKPIKEIIANKDYRGKPIIAEAYIKAKTPKKWSVNKKTTEAERVTAKLLSEKIGLDIAPAHISHLIRGYATSVGDDVLNILSKIIGIPKERGGLKDEEVGLIKKIFLDFKYIFRPNLKYTQHDFDIWEANKTAESLLRFCTQILSRGNYTKEEKREITQFFTDEIAKVVKAKKKAEIKKRYISIKQNARNKVYLIENLGVSKEFLRNYTSAQIQAMVNHHKSKYK